MCAYVCVCVCYWQDSHDPRTTEPSCHAANSSAAGAVRAYVTPTHGLLIGREARVMSVHQLPQAPSFCVIDFVQEKPADVERHQQQKDNKTRVTELNRL